MNDPFSLATDAAPATRLTKPDRNLRQTRSSQAAQTIRQRIKTGVYRPGEALPSLRALSSELEMSVPSMQRAIRLLVKEGVLEAQHGIGLRVLGGTDCSSFPLYYGFIQPYFSRFSMALQHQLEQVLDTRSDLCVVKSTHNSAARERTEIKRLMRSGINGLLVWPVNDDSNAAFFQEIAHSVPLVLVDRTLEGVTAPSVVLDYADLGRRIMRQAGGVRGERVLLVCDPSNISSFNQLKAAMSEEAAPLGDDALTVFDYPVIDLIEASYRNDYRQADACYQVLTPMLQSGAYDVLFCPHSEFFDQVFFDYGRAEVLSRVRCITLETPGGPPHSRRYYEASIERWNHDTTRMIITALDMLQDLIITRRPQRAVRLRFEKKQATHSSSARRPN